MRVFVSGTDTDVGKTVLAGILAHGLKAHYWKPVQAGRPTDSDTVAGWIGAARVFSERHVLAEPLSPNQAAERGGQRIELDDFSLPDHDGPLVVEGAGGLMVPLNDRCLMIDLIAKLGLPVVLAARGGLGTINHSLLSVAALQARAIPLLGVVFMGEDKPLNRRDIAQFGKVPVLGLVPHLTRLDAGAFDKVFQELAF